MEGLPTRTTNLCVLPASYEAPRVYAFIHELINPRWSTAASSPTNSMANLATKPYVSKLTDKCIFVISRNMKILFGVYICMCICVYMCTYVQTITLKTRINFIGRDSLIFIFSFIEFKFYQSTRYNFILIYTNVYLLCII